MYWLIGRKSVLSTKNKILLYNQVIKPVWTYGIQLWGCTSQENIETIQRFQNKVLRMIVNAPWYIRNTDLYRDLGIKTVAHEIQRYAKDHVLRLRQHVNEEVSRLILSGSQDRRLKRVRPTDLAVINSNSTLYKHNLETKCSLT